MSLLILINKLKWIEVKTLAELKALGEEIAIMINCLIKSIKFGKN
ncbi:MAG: hypothetical protein JSW26_27265 [Desulfobacterales bacterium]|nr:MAG: hypothetical protein JSW26_27265 [Desulfobacterales bacterium]